jgi:beta-N-acetylhexosaminidase
VQPCNPSARRGAGTLAVILALLGTGLGACGGDDADNSAPPRIIASATTSTGTTAQDPPKPAPPSAIARLVGQKFVVAYRDATVPPPRLLARIERGEVGGVILFTDNVPPSGAAGIRRVVTQLQAAARAGGNPRLLIATDQEGGDVRRMPGPPRRSPRELGGSAPASVRTAGITTGRSLRAMGIGVDLAPVADVPAEASSFLGTRAFGTASAPRVKAAVAFARGLQRAGIAATAKHYPGLGSSGARNTDLAAVTLATPRGAMERERAAFLAQVRGGTRLIMVSNATYLAYDRRRPAVVSPTIIRRLRRGGFRGVVISDELRVPGLRRYGIHASAAATRAGVDVLLFANGDGEPEYRALLAAVKSGGVRRRLVEQQVRRIAALKRWIAEQAAR